MSCLNDLGQPIGWRLDKTLPRPAPPRSAMHGRYGSLVPLDPAHAPALHAANSASPDGRMWTYMPGGPFQTLDDYTAWVTPASAMTDPLFFTICDTDDTPLGVASYLRIKPEVGVVEVGWIAMSPALQRTRLSTEAMYLMMKRVFDDLGYRRYEWKCDALNAPSRAAAQRLGFTYEGTFRQATHYKGRNRDTAWFSVIDSEWPKRRDAFDRWLDPSNFDADGLQRKRLEEA